MMSLEEFNKVMEDIFYLKREDPRRIIPKNKLGSFYKKLKENNGNSIKRTKCKDKEDT